jgi:hypothetical protein
MGGRGAGAGGAGGKLRLWRRSMVSNDTSSPCTSGNQGEERSSVFLARQPCYVTTLFADLFRAGLLLRRSKPLLRPSAADLHSGCVSRRPASPAFRYRRGPHVTLLSTGEASPNRIRSLPNNRTSCHTCNAPYLARCSGLPTAREPLQTGFSPSSPPKLANLECATDGSGSDMPCGRISAITSIAHH